MCKVDAELARRNRLRQEVEKRFGEVEATVIRNTESVLQVEGRLRQISQVLDTVSDFASVQAAINLQDEKDRELVSLFGAAEASASQAKSKERNSKFTLN